MPALWDSDRQKTALNGESDRELNDVFDRGINKEFWKALGRHFNEEFNKVADKEFICGKDVCSEDWILKQGLDPRNTRSKNIRYLYGI